MSIENKLESPEGHLMSREQKLESHRKNVMRYVALLILMLQFSALILTLRYSRMRSDTDQYFASTAVLCSEILKLVICFAKSSYDVGAKATWRNVFSKDHWKLAIPAILYVIQNNLQYVAATNLDATTFQVSYQLKILTTAFFSVLLLKRSLLKMQWVMLFVLTVSVILIQLPDSFWANAFNSSGRVIVMDKTVDAASQTKARLVGFMAVLISCFLSGLSGVYLEMVLKNTTSVSLWIRNLQLGVYSLFPALFLGVIGVDGHNIAEKGFFHGYTMVTFVVILLQAFGGILVALVMKYADNIMKNFATSLSIILSAIVNYVLWHNGISKGFFVGATMVIVSTFWFGILDQTKAQQQKRK